jgi:hypothetical protein
MLLLQSGIMCSIMLHVLCRFAANTKVPVDDCAKFVNETFSQSFLTAFRLSLQLQLTLEVANEEGSNEESGTRRNRGKVARLEWNPQDWFERKKLIACCILSDSYSEFILLTWRLCSGTMNLDGTHLRQEFEQAEHGEWHRGRHRETKLHEGKVDADVAAAHVDVGQEDDKGDGWLQKAASTANHDNHRYARWLYWRDLRGKEEENYLHSGSVSSRFRIIKKLFIERNFIMSRLAVGFKRWCGTHVKALLHEEDHEGPWDRADAVRDVLHEVLRDADIGTPAWLVRRLRIEAKQREGIEQSCGCEKSRFEREKKCWTNPQSGIHSLLGEFSCWKMISTWAAFKGKLK